MCLLAERYAELGKEMTNPYGEVSSTLSYMYLDPVECSALESALSGIPVATTELRPDLKTMDMDSFKSVLVGNEALRRVAIVDGNLIVDFVSFKN